MQPEAPRTRIRELRFLPQPVFSLEELREIVPFEVGSPYPFSDVARGRATRAIRLAFLTRGYLAVSVRDSTVLNADSSAALVVYSMQPGNRYTVRAVSITGNERTRPYVIQRELRIQPGQVYSYKLVEDSRQNLYSTGLFRSVAIREDDPDPKASTVDLSVRVVERNSRFVEGSIGFGRRDAFEVNLSASWGHRNLWGRGQRHADFHDDHDRHRRLGAEQHAVDRGEEQRGSKPGIAANYPAAEREDEGEKRLGREDMVRDQWRSAAVGAAVGLRVA